MLKLYVGNKNYSSWSMRPWVLLTQAQIPFEEVKVRFDSFALDSSFKKTITAFNPIGKVPVLVDDAAGHPYAIWDTLAIAEYLAETYHDKHLWPQDRWARARARSICAEMHAGFTALRKACPMNIEAALPEAGALIWRDKPAVAADVARLDAMWTELLQTYGAQHPDGMLFGAFSIADAYFAPVVMRFKTYALPVSDTVAAYMARVCALPSVNAWINDARAEQDFRDFEEPYRLTR